MCCDFALPLWVSGVTACSVSFAEFQVPVTEPDINNRLESLCLSMTEHALGGECVLFPSHRSVVNHRVWDTAMRILHFNSSLVSLGPSGTATVLLAEGDRTIPWRKLVSATH